MRQPPETRRGSSDAPPESAEIARSPALEVCAAFDQLDVDHLVYVPCSTARPILERLAPSLGARAIVASVEMEAVAIATGLVLAGRRPLLMMQDTGLGNALTVLTTLPKAYHVPLLIFATRTGGLNEINAVVHEYSDGVPGMLDACRIRRFELDYRVPLAAWRPLVVEAGRAAQLSRRPVVVLADLKAGHPEAAHAPPAGSGHTAPHRSVSSAGASDIAHDTASRAAPARLDSPYRVQGTADADTDRATRTPATTNGAPGDALVPLAHFDALRIIAETFADAPLVSSCGVSSRELASLGERDNHLYLLNSMGAVGATALGLALGLDGRVVVGVEGDGGFIMGLGTLATVAAVRPRGLVWIVVDNGVHCSTGGQPTAASVVDLGRLAAGAGLPTLGAGTPNELDAALADARTLASIGPVLVHVRTSAEVAPTPYFQPDAPVIGDRFRRALDRRS